MESEKFVFDKKGDIIGVTDIAYIDLLDQLCQADGCSEQATRLARGAMVCCKHYKEIQEKIAGEKLR